MKTRGVFLAAGALAAVIGGVVAARLVSRGAHGESAPPLSSAAFVHRPLGRPPEGLPWITDLNIVDLDQDGLLDVLFCDAQLNQIGWIRQVSAGEFVEQAIGGSVDGPAHVEVADLDGDGHLDVLVAAMGVIPPSNARLGAVVVLVNDGANRFTNRVLLQDVARVTYVAAADFNEDARPDLIVGQFGYLQGEIRWLENRGDGTFASHQLSDLPGTIHAPAVDIDRDGHLDVVALISQDIEEVHAFFGDGRGGFRQRVLYGSTNRDFGSSGLAVADVNGDGRIDVVYANGDGFDYATPGPRPWHGLQWLENRGDRQFTYHRVGDFPGCYSPAAVDLDGDGDVDLVASSAFNDWERPGAVSLMAFANDGRGRFTPRVLARDPTHLIVVRAADLCGDGRMELVTGALLFYPPFDRVSRITLWEPRG